MQTHNLQSYNLELFCFQIAEQYDLQSCKIKACSQNKTVSAVKFLMSVEVLLFSKHGSFFSLQRVVCIHLENNYVPGTKWHTSFILDQDICKIKVPFSLLFFKINFNIRYYDSPKPPKAWLFTSATNLCRLYGFKIVLLQYTGTEEL